MANNANYVSTGKPATAGAMFVAEYGTTIPTTADATLDDSFVGLGFVSEDGLTNSNSPESDTVKAWGGDIVAILQTEKSDTFTFNLIEGLNVEVLKVIYGSDNVSGDITSTDGISVTANATEAESYSWVVDMILNGGILKRIVIPNGKLSELDDITYKDDEIISYGLTIQAFPDDSGNTHYEYLLDTEITTEE